MRPTFFVTVGFCVIFAAAGPRPLAAQKVGAPGKAAAGDPQVVRAAQFAVKAQQQAAPPAGKDDKLALVKVLAAKKQVVSGMNYFLTLQVKQGGKLRVAEAEVWEQAWQKTPYKLTSWKYLDEADAQPAQPPAAKAAAAYVQGRRLAYKNYADEPYFVSNKFEPNQAQSFVVVRSLKQFNEVFGVGMTMNSKRPTIDARTFASQIVVAVVRRGPMCRYTVESVTAGTDGLAVRYQVKTDPPGSATYSVPLILSVPKGDYGAVVFTENGKEVKVLK